LFVTLLGIVVLFSSFSTLLRNYIMIIYKWFDFFNIFLFYCSSKRKNFNHQIAHLLINTKMTAISNYLFNLLAIYTTYMLKTSKLNYISIFVRCYLFLKQMFSL